MFKKFFLLGLMLIGLTGGLLTGTPAVFAEDCLRDPVYDRDWNAEVITGARLRDIPCMETSVVLTTLPVGEVIKVIAETDGYYKIRRANGQEGWVGQWLITATSKPFNATAPAQPETPVVPQERLYDIKGHQYETAIRWMDTNGIISGYPDGSFRPDGTLNRAELVKIMSLTYSMGNPLFNFQDQMVQNDTACFSDIAKGQWYTPYVCYAKSVGVVGGYPDGLFRPDFPVSRVEALKIVLNSLDMSVSLTTEKNYFDDTDVNAWYAPYISFAYFNNLIPEKSGNFYPARPILRGEVSNLIYLTYLLGQS